MTTLYGQDTPPYSHTRTHAHTHTPGAVVTALYGQDTASAWACYQDALGIDAFVSCDEAFLADGLFAAYRSAWVALVGQA